MLIFGLVIGPLIGLLAGDFLVRLPRRDARTGAAVLILLCLALLTIGIASLELRIGLVAGILLGSLMAATPLRMSGVDGD